MVQRKVTQVSYRGIPDPECRNLVAVTGVMGDYEFGQLEAKMNRFSTGCLFDENNLTTVWS